MVYILVLSHLSVSQFSCMLFFILQCLEVSSHSLHYRKYQVDWSVIVLLKLCNIGYIVLIKKINNLLHFFLVCN